MCLSGDWRVWTREYKTNIHKIWQFYCRFTARNRSHSCVTVFSVVRSCGFCAYSAVIEIKASPLSGQCHRTTQNPINPAPNQSGRNLCRALATQMVRVKTWVRVPLKGGRNYYNATLAVWTLPVWPRPPGVAPLLRRAASECFVRVIIVGAITICASCVGVDYANELHQIVVSEEEKYT